MANGPNIFQMLLVSICRGHFLAEYFAEALRASLLDQLYLQRVLESAGGRRRVWSVGNRESRDTDEAVP